LLFERLEQRLGALDALSRRLWLGGLTHTQGSLEARLATLSAMQSALCKGDVLPLPQWHWPPEPVAHAVWNALAELRLASHCNGHPELADTVIASLLFHLDFIVDYQDRGATQAVAIEMALDALRADWSERSDQLDELVRVFGQLPSDASNTRWDQLGGLLQSAGWQEVLRSRRLIESLPELVRVIRELGRSRQTNDDDVQRQASVEVLENVEAQSPRNTTVRVPDMPGQTRGICRSDRIARMLPAEAMLLGHPRLRLVWHARRAERTLLTYEDDDHLDEVRLHRTRVQRPRPGIQAGKRQERGPMLVCVDTSASMQGAAEAVAKAVILEAMRAAHAQQRACHVIAFGAAEEVVDMELAVDGEGIAHLTDFLAQSFHGGTDICGPLERVLEKIEHERWQLADLLIASDGEFGATSELAARLDEAKRKLGLRVQGVLIGDRETIGFLEVADHILPIRQWRRYGASGGDSPIHTHRLTALYFPGSLRNEENRKSTLSGAAAADALRKRGQDSQD
jgi:uncharacterized protein with von Willebrand factor type A (vWA) domain